MATKRKAAAMSSVEEEDPVDPSDELVFIGLGGCQEVGRSCHILQYKGKTVMVRRNRVYLGHKIDRCTARCRDAYRAGRHVSDALL